MKSLNKLIAGSAAAVVLTICSVLGFTAFASAQCTQYNDAGTSTSATPIFNNFCGVPNFGDETDFVRVRQNTTGDPTSGSNAAYVDGLTSSCDDGSVYDVRTYVHNGADPAGNDPSQGSIAVAHNVSVAMSAPINTTGNNFAFNSSINASNAASVSDGASLNCNGEPVELTLVPASVHVYSQIYGWKSIGDNSAVNGSITVGSPTFASGDVFACWEFRIVVVYQVTVHKKVVPPPVTATCDLLTVTADRDRKVQINQFKFTSTNANVKNVAVDWGDDSAKFTTTDANSVVGQTHQYGKDGTYLITAVITFSVAGKPDVTSGGAGTGCAQEVTFKSQQPPAVTQAVSVPPAAVSAVSQRPSQIANVGPGSITALFVAATLAGTLGYRWYIGRRLSLDDESVDKH